MGVGLRLGPLLAAVHGKLPGPLASFLALSCLRLPAHRRTAGITDMATASAFMWALQIQTQVLTIVSQVLDLPSSLNLLIC